MGKMDKAAASAMDMISEALDNHPECFFINKEGKKEIDVDKLKEILQPKVDQMEEATKFFQDDKIQQLRDRITRLKAHGATPKECLHILKESAEESFLSATDEDLDFLPLGQCKQAFRLECVETFVVDAKREIADIYKDYVEPDLSTAFSDSLSDADNKERRKATENLIITYKETGLSAEETLDKMKERICSIGLKMMKEITPNFLSNELLQDRYIADSKELVIESSSIISKVYGHPVDQKLLEQMLDSIGNISSDSVLLKLTEKQADVLDEVMELGVNLEPRELYLRRDIENFKKEGLSAKACLTRIKQETVKSGLSAQSFLTHLGISDQIPSVEEITENHVKNYIKEAKAIIEEVYNVKFVKKKRRKRR